MNKTHIREHVIAGLRSALALQVGAAQLARDEAISEESKAENKYDTHSIEAGYLAEGQARQAAELEESINLIAALPLPAFSPTTPIALGAFVEVSISGKSEHYFLCPRAGGVDLEVDGVALMVVTPSSPLGRQLLGKRVGDAVQLPGRKTTARISRVE